MRTIKVGDKVHIRWSYSDIPDTGIVEHVPEDTGDMWYIKCDRAAYRMAVNPCASQLNVILRLDEEND